MNKGLWGGLLLSLGWVSGLAAQEGPWRPASDSPAAVIAGELHLESVPGVELGRPEPVVPPPAALAGRAMSLPPGFLQPVSYTVPETSASPAPPAPLPSVLRDQAHPPTIIAASVTLPASPSDPGFSEASEFATARPVPTGTPVARPYPLTRTSAILPGAMVQAVPPVFAAPVAAPPSGPAAFNPWAPESPNPWAPGPEDYYSGPLPGPNPLNPCFYISAEYLLWWIRGENTPVLLTTSSPSSFGILGQPTTQVLFGGGPINGGARSGARFNAGWWLNDNHTFALDFGAFFLCTATTNFAANSGQFPVLARPFFNVNSNQQFSELVALPGVTTGSATIHAPTSLWGFDVNTRWKLCCGDCWRVNGLVGFRYLYLSDSITITENIQGEPTAPAPFTNETITVFDRFATTNQFYGGQVGVDGRYQYGRWSIDARAKLALGATVQTIDINGGQRFVSPGGQVATFQGGLLAVPGNIGRFRDSRFSVVPEVGVTLGYQIRPHVRAFAGYNVLYWTNVVRAGDQIDPLLNVSKIPNFPTNSPPSSLNRPLVPFHQSDFWAQGLTFGLEFTF